MRIAKFVAAAGVCSRRAAEALVRSGRVRVNGVEVEDLGWQVEVSDEVMVDGVVVHCRSGLARLWKFHKPRGCVVSERDERGRRTVFDIIGELGNVSLPRLIAVGRLDYNSEGLLLLSDDGGLARVLEHPSSGLRRRYRVRVFGQVELRQLEALGLGVCVDGVCYRPVAARLLRRTGSHCWLEMDLHEGKNREIRKLMQFLGYSVNRLIRVGYGDFDLGDLKVADLKEIHDWQNG